MENRSYKYYDFVAAAFVAVLLISNIASAAKIVDWGVNILGLQLAFDAGTLLFPVSYIFGDVLTEVYGYKRSRRVIWSGFGASLLMALTLGLVGLMPGEATWESYAGQNAYNVILGGVASGGIIIASLSAYFVGEFSNSVILAKLKVATQGRWLWVRTIGSTLVGEGVDSVIFIVVATLFGVFPPALMLTLIVSNYIFKVAIEVVFTPITYAIVNFLKGSEQEDYYDTHTNFNPFKLAN
jgi:uncharacterized integral membrane protein (TIGR00697 family)